MRSITVLWMNRDHMEALMDLKIYKLWGYLHRRMQQHTVVISMKLPQDRVIPKTIDLSYSSLKFISRDDLYLKIKEVDDQLLLH